MENNPYNRITLEELEAAFKQFGINQPFMENTKWTDEEGNKYSSWNVSTGKLNAQTGDGGAKMIIQALKDSVNASS